MVEHAVQVEVAVSKYWVAKQEQAVPLAVLLCVQEVQVLAELQAVQ